MKRINLGFCILLLSTVLLFNCNKEPAVEPTQDTELQTSIDASYATFLVSDIEMNCSFIGENESENYQSFYFQGPVTNGTCTVIRDIATNRVSITYNKTTCHDGRLRDGSIFLFFAEPQYLQYPATGNELHIRDYNFTGRISLQFYKVDDWFIDEKDFSAFIKNLRPDFKTPIIHPLKWTFEGEFKMKKNLDSMTWKGKFTKTLVNSSDISVFAASTQSAIVWPKAVINYVGYASGTTPGNVPFTYSIFPSNPVTRTFTCSPDPVSTVSLQGVGSTPTATPKYSQFHPFTSGVISFTTGTAYPRVIYFANEGNTYGGPGENYALPPQCDNKGTVQIKGVFHPIDLKK